MDIKPRYPCLVFLIDLVWEKDRAGLSVCLFICLSLVFSFVLRKVCGSSNLVYNFLSERKIERIGEDSRGEKKERKKGGSGSTVRQGPKTRWNRKGMDDDCLRKKRQRTVDEKKNFVIFRVAVSGPLHCWVCLWWTRWNVAINARARTGNEYVNGLAERLYDIRKDEYMNT